MSQKDLEIEHQNLEKKEFENQTIIANIEKLT